MKFMKDQEVTRTQEHIPSMKFQKSNTQNSTSLSLALLQSLQT